MRDFDMEKITTFKFKCTALAILAIAFIIAFIPLWQLGIDNTFRHEMIASKIRLNELDSEERALIASASDYQMDENNLAIYAKASTI